MRIPFLTRITITMMLLTVTVSCFFAGFKKNLEKTYENLALVQTKSIVTKIINQVVVDQMSLSSIEIDYSKEEYVSYDVNQINRMVSSLSSQIVNVLGDINHSNYAGLLNVNLNRYDAYPGIVYEMELGKLFNNFFFNSLGSKYPIKFTLAGDVLARTDLTVEEFGINNALVSLNMLLSFDFSLILPLTTKLDQIDVKIPLSIMMIEGDVPSFLYGTHVVEGTNSYIIEVERL